ncbi:MAG: serine hydrolase [Candidatus Faecousia sp.]|nr:serine hydrolase [Bacillota bacterium]MDD7340936.1 serine hydrolase [Bacillota bacterium]MDY2809409.1 serine hydrolase [Candidatus Faecousia sp.]
MRKEFPRTTPEAVGIPSASIEWLLDRLEEGWTEPHGLMIMRHGKVCAEGWWAPYATGIRHGLQSHTKTYAATAVGIAYTEGLLKLTDRIVDIFPDEIPENPSENLKKLTVRDVLCMGCGMDTMPRPSKDWIREFLATPVNHVPGTTFMYNSTGSTFLGAIVRKLTGLGLHDYLKPRLFDKIGIDAENLRWITMPDGMEVGGGGLFATTEDNLRLMKLYADGGVWEGERILAEDYVKLATSKQNDSATERAVNPPAEDNFVGYGFQIWMCRPKGVYRADGAMGQFTIVFPERDMLLAITENASGSTGGAMPQKALDTIWKWMDALPGPETEILPEDPEASAHLARRMQMLALPAPRRSPESPLQEKINGSTYAVTDGYFALADAGMVRFMSGEDRPGGAKALSLTFAENACTLTCLVDGKPQSLTAAMDGTRLRNELPGMPSIALCSGCWEADNVFRLRLRMVETCNETSITFTFSGDQAQVETCSNHVFAGKAQVTHLTRI